MAAKMEKNNVDADFHVSKTMGTKPKVYKDGQYVDPVLKSLSKINGEINKLTKNQLQIKLKEFGLDSRGVKEVLRKRLKNYYKKKKISKPKICTTQYDYLAVIDFEATCEEKNIGYRHEIIEFPIVLIDVEKMEVIDKFHSYVRPLVNPKLTDFCTGLTGISQETVDQADTFQVVLSHVEEFLASHHMGSGKTFAVLTDGPWDMFRFMYYQCVESRIEMPSWCKKWVNIRKCYCNFYHCGRGGIEVMLKNLGMKFEGSPHSGIDDAMNIARIAIKLMKDGCALNINEHLQVTQRPNDQRPEVRYEAVHQDHDVDSDVDEEEVEIVFHEDGDIQGRGCRKKSPRQRESDSLVHEFASLSVQQQGENLDDLIGYFKLQKN